VALPIPVSALSDLLKRIGLRKLSRLGRLVPPTRYERPHAGELPPIDVKSPDGPRAALGIA
jgi:hypothetical protein